MWLEIGVGVGEGEGEGEGTEDEHEEPRSASREYVMPLTCSTRVRSFIVPK